MSTRWSRGDAETRPGMGGSGIGQNQSIGEVGERGEEDPSPRVCGVEVLSGPQSLTQLSGGHGGWSWDGGQSRGRGILEPLPPRNRSASVARGRTTQRPGQEVLFLSRPGVALRPVACRDQKWQRALGHRRGGEEAPHTPRVPWDTSTSLVQRCDGGTHRPGGHG